MNKKQREWEEQEEQRASEAYRKWSLFRLLKSEDELMEKFPGYENYCFIPYYDDVSDPEGLLDDEDECGFDRKDNHEFDTPQILRVDNSDDRVCNNCEYCLKNSVVYREYANIIHAGEIVCGQHAESIFYPEKTFCNFYSPKEEPCLSRKE